jgi:hypothetical protein
MGEDRTHRFAPGIRAFRETDSEEEPAQEGRWRRRSRKTDDSPFHKHFVVNALSKRSLLVF